MQIVTHNCAAPYSSSTVVWYSKTYVQISERMRT